MGWWAYIHILPKLINDSINIENAIKNIYTIYYKIMTILKKKNKSIEFNLKQNDFEKGLLNEIKLFGGIKIVEK